MKTMVVLVKADVAMLLVVVFMRPEKPITVSRQPHQLKTKETCIVSIMTTIAGPITLLNTTLDSCGRASMNGARAKAKATVVTPADDEIGVSRPWTSTTMQAQNIAHQR